MILTFVALVGSEIFTGEKFKQVISSSNSVQSQSDNLVVEMVKQGKNFKKKSMNILNSF